MDFKQVALIAGLAVVSYFLLLQWNEDYPNAPVQPPSVASEIPGTTDLPTAPSNSSSDIPEVSVNSRQPQAAQTTDASRIITISTPVQIVKIDLLGGDIIELSLPKHPTTLETPDIPFVLLRNDAAGVYVAQSGLVGANGPDASGRPLFQSTQTSYQINDSQDALSVDLEYTDPNGIHYTKRFIFQADDYLITVDYIINNTAGTEWRGNLFGQIKRDEAEDPSSGGGFGMRSYLGAAITTDDDPYEKYDFGDMEDSTTDEVSGGWIAFSQQHFLSSWIPNAELTHSYTTTKNNSSQYLMRFISPESVVAANSVGTISSSFWAGPKDQYRLKEISPNLGLTIDYGMLFFIAQPVFWLLTKLNAVINNFGLSIIAMTIVIKILFSPLSAASYRSMAKMRRLTPKVTQLKERFGEDKQKLMKAQMELWKKEKVNPMGGCLPMLLQMPVLIGIYWVLNASVELRHSPFFLWYQDLSAMDPYFILPIIMGASMYVSQLMTPMTTMDPMQAKMLKLMPIFFTVFFFWFPSGLVLYWLVSNVFNIGQQWYINKRVEQSFQQNSA